MAVLVFLMAFGVWIVWAVVCALVAWGLVALTGIQALGIAFGVLLFLGGTVPVGLVSLGFLGASVS